MTKDDLMNRCKEIEEALIKVVAQHTSLSGQLAEAKYWLDNFDKKSEEEVKEVEAEIVG